LIEASYPVACAVVLAPNAASAQERDFNEDLNGFGCGFWNAYVQAKLNWSGWYVATTGYAKAIIYEDPGDEFNIVGFREMTRDGESDSILAEAVGDESGKFRGRLRTDTSFYQNAHTNEIDTFYCQ